MATTAANSYFDVVPPPPLKFEVERTSFSSRRNQKPLEYNFNYFRPNFDISFPENATNSSNTRICTNNDTTVNNYTVPNNTDRCRSLTPKNPLKDSNFRISPNSAFTPVSLPIKKSTRKSLDSSKSFDEDARNSEISFGSKDGPEDAQARMNATTRQQSTTTKSTKRSSSSKAKNNNKDMPDRETNLEYALNINPSLSTEEYHHQGIPNDMSPRGRHYDMAMEKARIKPVVYQHKWPATPEYLEKNETKAPVVETTENEKINFIDDNRRKNPTISTSLYVGDTDIENKQNFWHKVFKFEQKSDPSINDEKKFITGHNKFPLTQHQNGQQISVVDHRQNDQNQENYSRKYTPSNNTHRKIQKHGSKTICIFPERKKIIEQRDFLTPKFSENMLNDAGRLEEVEKSTSIERPLCIGDQQSDNGNVVVERILTKSVNNNNVLDRAQIFEKIAQKQKKLVADTTKSNNVPFFKKIGNYFSSKLSTSTPNNNENGKKSQQQRSHTLQLSSIANDEKFPIELSSNNVSRRFSENCGQKSDFRILVAEKRQNVINDETSEDEEENTENLPAHEDKSSKMNISEKTKLFELKSQIHMRKQDDLDNCSKKRVSFVENGDHHDGIERSSMVNQRRKFRTNNGRRKTQPVTQAEIDKARNFSQSTSDVNYQAHRFIQTGLERVTSKSSVVDYYVPNFKVKDDEACRKQAKQLSKCKKVSLW